MRADKGSPKMDKSTLQAFFSRVRNTPGAVAEAVGDLSVYAGMVLRSRNVHVAALLFGLFAVASVLVPFDSLYLTVTFVLVSVEVLLSLAYLPAFLMAIVSSPVRERDQLIMGIWVAWNFDLATRVWSLAYRYTDNSDWMLTTNTVTLLLFGRLLAAMLHVTAPDAIDGRVPASSWMKLGLAFLAGVVVATTLIYLTAGKALTV